jgi:group I intron endonuclease
MPDYAKGKIFKLVNELDDEIYVGSTTVKLCNRKAKHKDKIKHHPDRLVYQHITKVGWDNVKIILLEEYPCGNKEQLEQRERYWIDKLKPSLNKQVPSRTRQEREAVKVFCEVCMLQISKTHLKEHSQTKKHISNLEINKLEKHSQGQSYGVPYLHCS